MALIHAMEDDQREPGSLHDTARARRIIIVDDDDDIREITTVSLEISEGWHVVAASSVADGLRAAQIEAPDAILLDVMMPDTDGPTGLRALRENPATQKIPVIFLTAKAGERDLRQTFAFRRSERRRVV